MLELHEGGSARKHRDDSKGTGFRSTHPNTYNTYLNTSHLNVRDGAEIMPYVVSTTLDDDMATAAGSLVSLMGTLSLSASVASLPEPEHIPKHGNAVVVFIIGFAIINLLPPTMLLDCISPNSITSVHPLTRMLVMRTLMSLLHLI
jgi:hypothetical protein